MTKIKVGDKLVADKSVLEVVGVEYGSTEKKHLLESPVIRTIDEFGNHSANLEKTLLADGYVVKENIYYTAPIATTRLKEIIAEKISKILNI